MVSYEFKAYTKKNLHRIKNLDDFPAQFKREMEICANVIPFRVSNYVINELIDWGNIPEDPIFQLTFPQPGMLSRKDLFELLRLKNVDENLFDEKVRSIQLAMNPHPAGQMDLNLPVMGRKVLPGMQHKYDETILFFPFHGQFCHSYCTYCFRWVQFAGFHGFKLSSKEKEDLFNYVDLNPQITDILFTGGDPMVMRAKTLKSYLEPFLKKKPGNLSSIRFGTKSLAYWPYRFFRDKDSKELLKLFEKIAEKGYHLTIMAHFSHHRELETQAVEKAIKTLRSTGAQIRCQAPLIRHINDDEKIWSKMWTHQVNLGAIPYYMFVERDTGPKNYFKVSLSRAYEIFTKAYNNVSGLARTVRGPSMSASPGKILVDGVTEIKGEKLFIFKFIQARKKEWVNQIFFGKFDEYSSWINEVSPAFGEKTFFYQEDYEKICKTKFKAIDNCFSN